MDQEAEITLYRRSNSIGGLSLSTVFIDNKEVGTISDGETKTFKTSAGSHSIYLKSGWSKSNTIKIQSSLNNTNQLESDIPNIFFLFRGILVTFMVFVGFYVKDLHVVIAVAIIIIVVAGTYITFRTGSMCCLKEIKEDSIC